MALENALIAKIVGSVTVLGGAGSAGVVYRNEIINKFQDVFGKKEEINNYLFVVAGTVAVEAGQQSQKTLYEIAEPKTKNYQCEIADKKYECDIVKEISKNSDKKWINTKTDFETTSITKDGITKDKFNTADNLFLLKIISKTKLSITRDATQKIDIIENVASADKTFKKFGQLTPVFGKENNQILGKINLFLGKVSSITAGTTEEESATINGTGEQYKCGFDTTAINKDCEIYKFVDSQTPANETDYSSLTFAGNMESDRKIKASDSIRKHEYFLIKFSDESNLTSANFLGKNKLIYAQEGVTENKKTINFSPVLVSFLHPQKTGSNNNLLIIND